MRPWIHINGNAAFAFCAENDLDTKVSSLLLVFALTGCFLWHCETVPLNVDGFIALNTLLIAWVCIWPRGVTVSTLDSESSDRGSNPREAFE